MIPARFEAATLDDFRPLPAAARAFVNGETEGLLLHGPVGVGKTHLAIACLRAAESPERAHRVFVPMQELFVALKGSYEAGEGSWEELRPAMCARVAVLDDLGVGRATAWERDIAATIIGHRYNEMLRTIITTNYGGEELQHRVGQRAYSRLQEMCRSVRMNGWDRRQNRTR